MNVVGRVGSLISQGVYSVATPFHPFGGAVDVIVVQQQDGSFRSTPWYVRFGKFQGVLKGAEKVVRIAVNGVEANFHMYLDNSGEAYFVREVDADKVSNGDSGGEDVARNDNILRLEHTVSDSGVAQLVDDFDDSSTAQLERSESETMFYEFQDEQSSLDESVTLSDYGSSRYDGLSDQNFGDAQNTDSEVILVSVDGHVLTAPVLASEKADENVQLSTPQFHLGPGNGAEFETKEEFNTTNNVWVGEYKDKLDIAISDNGCPDVHGLGNPPEVKGSADLSNDFHQIKELRSLSNQECEFSQIKQNGRSASNENVDLSLNRFELQVSNISSVDSCPREIDHSLEASRPPEGTFDGVLLEGAVDKVVTDGHESIERSNFQPPDGSRLPDLKIKANAVEKHVLDRDVVGLERISLASEDGIPVGKGKQFGTSEADVEASCPGHAAPEDEGNKSEIVESQDVSSRNIQTCSAGSFEISLCKNELYAGMGLNAAAEVFDAHRITAEDYRSSSASIVTSGNLIVRFGERYLPWEKAAPVILGMAAFGLDLPIEPKDAIPIEQYETSNPKEDDSVSTPTSSSRRWRLWPIPFRRVKTLEHSASALSNDDVFLDSESGFQNSEVESPSVTGERSKSPRKLFIRTNVLTSEQIASLNLKDGQNMVTFSFSTRVLGRQQVDAHIYLWKWNAKIVISDVDGTITKSDVLGQFMPLVGKDWTQSGVAKLFCAIKENGYQLLFLSARAIVQAYLTRNFLLNLKQDGKTLPNGPVVISPDGLFPSLYREVIRRAPHEFKIACLEDIKKLFPSDYNPFYAGFGNRDTDEFSYLKIGIPKGKIFIINPKGEVATSHRLDTKSYTSLHTLVNDMFPPTSLAEQEDYNSWNFWKMPLPDID